MESERRQSPFASSRPMNLLNQHIEALIFCSETSITLDEIAASLKLSYGWELTDDEIVAAIAQIREKYQDETFAFSLEEISEGYQFLTKKDYYPTVSALIQHKAKKKLSVAQMETLAIIAYKQPITKSEIEHIRGVSCDYAIQKLLEKELVAISGKSDGPGRPIMYSTSDSFMDYFGIKSVKDLPQLKDLHLEQNEIGQPSELQDNEPEAYGNDSEVTAMSEAGAETPVLSESLSEEGDAIEAPIMGSEDYSAPIVLSEEADKLYSTVPPAAGEAEDLELPDRKQIFLENQPGAPESEAADEKAPFRNESE